MITFQTLTNVQLDHI